MDIFARIETKRNAKHLLIQKTIPNESLQKLSSICMKIDI